MERFLFHGPLSLANLSQIENRMLEDFDNKHFTALGQGPFLKFIQTNETIKKVTSGCFSSLIRSKVSFGAKILVYS